MKLRTKLILSFTVVIILVGGIGITFSYINQSVKDKVTSESEEAIQEVNLVGKMESLLFRSLTQTQYMLNKDYRKSLSMNFSRGDKSVDKLSADLDSTLSTYKGDVERFRQLTKVKAQGADSISSANMRRMVKKLKDKSSIYISLIGQFQDPDSQSYDDRKMFFTVTIEPYFRSNLMPLIKNIRRKTQQSHQKKITKLNSELGKINSVLGFATLGALIVALLITLFLYRSIANPIQKVTEAAKKIGRGNFDERISYHSADELGELSDAFDRMVKDLNDTTVSKNYVDSIIESMADLLVVTDEFYNINRINTAGTLLVDANKEQLMGKDVETIFNELPKKILQSDTKSAIESQNARLAGSDSGIQVNVSKGAIKDSDENITGYVFVASDISSEIEARQKVEESLKEKEILIAEIHHRVKNNLAVISGLIEMQLWEADNAHAVSALQQSQLRVQSIALVHKKLYQTENLSHIKFRHYTSDLLKAIETTYLEADSNISINSNIQDVALNINQAVPCSLLINELVVNALKHAFDGAEEGNILIELVQDGPHVTLRVQDDGRGFDEDPQEDNSLGLALVSTLTQQVDGELAFRNEHGAVVEITFTVEEVVA